MLKQQMFGRADEDAYRSFVKGPEGDPLLAARLLIPLRYRRLKQFKATFDHGLGVHITDGDYDPVLVVQHEGVEQVCTLVCHWPAAADQTASRAESSHCCCSAEPKTLQNAVLRSAAAEHSINSSASVRSMRSVRPSMAVTSCARCSSCRA